MKTAWLFLSLLVMSCHYGEKQDRTPTQPVGATKDLSVSHEQWTTDDPKHAFKGYGIKPNNLVSFTLKNSSTSQAYKKVRVMVEYLNKNGQLLGSEELRVIKTVKPGETLQIDKMFGGSAKEGTDKALCSVLGAQETD